MIDLEGFLLSAFGVVLGFLFSQSINIISFLRRPKLNIEASEDCVYSMYTGNPPETDSEIEFGFYIRNVGKTLARDIRVFVCTIECDRNSKGMEYVLDHIVEIDTTHNWIPPSEAVLVRLGKSTWSNPSLILHLRDRKKIDDIIWAVEADTYKKVLMHVTILVASSTQSIYTKKKLIVKNDPEFLSQIPY